MQFNFTYKDLHGTLSQSIWTGKEKLLIDGEEIKKTGKEWITKSGLHIRSKHHLFLFRQLIIDEKEIKLIQLKKWEWFFVFLPGVLFFLGGAMPAALAIGGVYLTLSIFVSKNINPSIKILASLGYFILAVIIILGTALSLQQ